jgi:uncharacterized protein DUF4167
MRPGQQNKRSRGRSGRKNVNSLTRSFESNGPDVKVRGNAAHVAEKYVQLARDASAAGDLVMSENYLQHAEHYFRLISAAQAQNQSLNQNQGQNQGQNPARLEQSGPERINDDDDQADERQAGPDTQTRVNGTARAQESRGESSRESRGETRSESSGDADGGEERPPRREARPRRPRRRRESGAQAPDPSLAGAPQPAVTLESEADPAPAAVEDAAE